jgi:hypothetical protein
MPRQGLPKSLWRDIWARTSDDQVDVTPLVGIASGDRAVKKHAVDSGESPPQRVRGAFGIAKSWRFSFPGTHS